MSEDLTDNLDESKTIELTSRDIRPRPLFQTRVSGYKKDHLIIKK